MNYFVNTCVWSHSLICSQVGSHPLRRMDNPRPKILFLYTLWSSSSNLLSSLFIVGTRGDINATTGVKYLGWCKASTLLLVSNTAGGLCIKDDENTFQVDKTITWLPDGSVALLNVFQWIERKREWERGVFMLIWERISKNKSRFCFKLSSRYASFTTCFVLSYNVLFPMLKLIHQLCDECGFSWCNVTVSIRDVWLLSVGSVCN